MIIVYYTVVPISNNAVMDHNTSLYNYSIFLLLLCAMVNVVAFNIMFFF